MNSKTEKQIAKLRDAADAMEQLVQEKLNPAVANQRITPRRAAMADSIVQEGRKLRRVQVGLRAIAQTIESQTCPPELAGISGKGQVHDLLTWTKLSNRSGNQLIISAPESIGTREGMTIKTDWLPAGTGTSWFL